jgi:hypothetical protein
VVRFLQTFAFLFALSSICLGDDFAERLYKAGQRAEKAGDKFHAFLLYSEAARADPQNPDYVMRKAMLQADVAMSASTRIDGEAPHGDSDLATGNALPKERIALLPPRLKGPDGLKSFDIKGDARAIFENVMSSYGLMVAFEYDYQMPPSFRFHVEDVRFEDALRTLELQSNSFLVPVNERLALVVRDTTQKRNEMAPVIGISVPIPDRISVQDAQEMMTAVVSALEIRKYSLDPGKRLVYLRDQVSKIVAARQMFNELSRARAQVEVDVDFLEVSRNSSLGYGLSLPNSSSIISLGSFLGNSPTASTAESFLRFGGGASFFGVGIASSMVIATFSKSDTNTILKSQVVALDGQPATLHVGQRYPIVTATYSGGSTSAVTSGQASGLNAPPSINYEDLGLVLKVTPSVHEREVTLDVSSEFKVLGATDANGNPSISTRKYAGKVRLGFDESAVIAGLIGSSKSDTRSGIYGVASIPWIGRFLRQNNLNDTDDQVLLVLTPRLLDVPPWEFGGESVWVGTESKPLTVF